MPVGIQRLPYSVKLNEDGDRTRSVKTTPTMSRLFHTPNTQSHRRYSKVGRVWLGHGGALCVCLALALNGCTGRTIKRNLVNQRFLSVVTPPGAGRAGTKLVVEPQDGVKPVTHAIDAASRTVFLEAYILTQHSIERALERAAAQGVAVYVLLDPRPFGMGNQPAQMASGLRAAGVAVRWTWLRYYFTHAKFLVVDDRLAVVSTANFSQAAFKSNRELLVLDHDFSDVHDLSNVFRSDWDHIPFGRHNTDLVLSPNSRPVLTTFLKRARRSIQIYAEEVADPALDTLLIRLHRRLRVEILVASGYASPGLTALLRAGVDARALRYPYIHAKMFLVDGVVAFVGSENLSPTSLDLNREVGILVRGETVARAVTTFTRDWSKAARERPSAFG